MSELQELWMTRLGNLMWPARFQGFGEDCAHETGEEVSSEAGKRWEERSELKVIEAPQWSRNWNTNDLIGNSLGTNTAAR